jgi:hypothetical protein
MINVANVADFQFVERDPGYDKVNNPLRRTVAELTPVAIAWRSGSVQRDIRSAAGIGGMPLVDGSGIAIIEGPYDSTANRAYIVNADGSLRAEVSVVEATGQVMFYDVLYMSGTLTFLAAAPDRDVRISVNERDGSVLSVSEFR